jgi:hypothetical protein
MSTNKIEANFSKPYKHGLTRSTAYVTAFVSIDTPNHRFKVDITSGHDTLGSGSEFNLPKMEATLRMKEEILEFIKQHV